MIKLNPKITLLLFVLLCLGISSVAGYIDPYFLDVILGIGISIVLATSLNLVNGYTGQFSLGHAGFMAIGAYISSYLTTAGLLSAQSAYVINLNALFSKLGMNISTTSGFGAAAVFLPALLAGGIGAGLAGFIVGVPSLRLRGDYLAIVTLGFGEIIRVLIQNVEAVGGARGLNGIPTYTNFFWTFALAGLTVYIVTTMVHSTYGRGFLAVHDDEIAAEAMGVNTTKYKVLAFVVSSFFAGVAGGLYAHFKTYINPEGFNFIRSIEIVVMVILGGMGNTVGVILAAVLLTVLPEVLRPVSEYRMILYSLLIIVLMLVRPQGLFTLRRQYKEK